MNLYSLLIYIEHNRDESPKDVHLRLTLFIYDPYCTAKPKITIAMNVIILSFNSYIVSRAVCPFRIKLGSIQLSPH